MLKDKVAIQTIKLGIFFFILFTGFLSLQNIITHVYQVKGLSAVGPIGIAVNYLTFLISNTLAVKCKLSFKTQLLIGSLAYSVNMSTGIYVQYIQNHLIIYLIVAFGAAIGGISAGFLWVSQGGYLREICKKQHDKGKYNAIFSTLLAFSSFTAGITTTFFLGYFSSQIYFIALTSMSLLSSLYCLLFLKDISQSDSLHINNSLNQNNATQQSLISQYKNIQSQIQLKQDNVLKNIIDSLKFYKNMVFVLIFLIMDGLLLGIQSNQMTKLIPQDIKRNIEDYQLKAGILTIFIGAGSMVGSYISGPIADGFGLKFFGKVTIFSYVITCMLTFAASEQQMYWLACTISFLWGLSYYLFEGWIYVSIYKLFEGKLQALAINKQVHCVSMAGFQVLVILTGNKFDIKWLMCGIIFFVIPMIWCLFKVDFNKDKFGKQLLQVKMNDHQNTQSSNHQNQEKY